MNTFNPDLLTGTLIHYYATCKREAWLYSRKIHADQWDENILMGKALAEIKEEQLHDFPFSNLKFDKIGKERGEQKLTWRQVIRREVNRIKRNVVETSEYEPFVLV